MDENVILAALIGPHGMNHAVFIYGYENEKFKVKDSYGRKYEIPVNRPDSQQVLK